MERAGTSGIPHETMCGMSLRATAIICALAQITLTASSSIFMYGHLPHTTIIKILITITLFCCSIAIVFLLICIAARKFGTLYDVLLHAYLLSMLLMALTSFFEVMYFPLSMVQSFTSWSSPLITYHSILIAVSAFTLFFQFVQRNIVENMLPHMQCSFK